MQYLATEIGALSYGQILIVFQVDMGAVAEALGYGNVKSAGNRFSALKKKYNLRVELSYHRGDVSIKS